MLMIKLITTFIIFTFLSVDFANAQITKYFCSSEINKLFISFDFTKKTVITGNSTASKYWRKVDYTYWQSVYDYTLYEYTFKSSFNKLSGILKVKSHHLVTSENKWYNYECSISEKG